LNFDFEPVGHSSMHYTTPIFGTQLSIITPGPGLHL